MHKILIVTFLLAQSVFAEKLSWPQKTTSQLSQKSLETICKKTSERLQKKICKTLKKDVLASKDKVKITLEDRGTAQLRYQDAKIKLRRTDEAGTLLVNRKALHLDEMTSFNDLKKKISKLAGEENAAAVTPTMLYLYQVAEHETCQKAEAVVKSCLKKDQKKSVEQSTQFNSVITFLSPSKKEALQFCKCEQKICGFAAKAEKGLKKDYELCQKQTKELMKQAKKEKTETEELKAFSTAISGLPKKEKSRQPALFKEDSYKD